MHRSQAAPRAGNLTPDYYRGRCSDGADTRREGGDATSPKTPQIPDTNGHGAIWHVGSEEPARPWWREEGLDGNLEFLRCLSHEVVVAEVVIVTGDIGGVGPGGD